MDRLLATTASLEAATGLALIAAPAVVVRWLLGSEIAGASVPIARVAGVALLSLGIACWPGRSGAGGTAAALRAMLSYNTLITLYLLGVGVGREWVGPLLWPVVALHAALTVWCVACLRRRPEQNIEKTERIGQERPL